ncbi:MAE_28990/MAE_18760 family HEPN-like nuclease [Sodalinema gerasimenkoae]|uniref:MAE_28990/MAE_18760 family HEPN-like nuclease n=1 Tax=Sodalinema gerasimenkoae TaxID=2862348 RepID=UPI00135BAF47|nr:MAE_28990/MAE_18760 family HEPN-like nuclease [Sodalinema gerasimenkoae]
MKSQLFYEFNPKAVEVSQYFMFLKKLERETYNPERIRSQNPVIDVYFNQDIERTLKSAGFLLLYNLIEGTIRSSIQYIFDHISSKSVSFDDLRRDLKLIVLKNLRNKSPDKLIQSINQISLDIIAETFDANDIFSGNVDARKIKTLAKNYGFSSQSIPMTRDGADLLDIKRQRNDLAHGIKSFNEIGKEIPSEELFRIKNRVIIYLKYLIINIESYLENQDYLDKSSEKSSR